MSLTAEASSTVNNDITGIVLAGGKSRRMGQDKATLPMLNGTMLSNALLFLQQHFQKVIIVGNRPDLEIYGVPVIHDIYPGSSLGGIHAGLNAVETNWVFIMPCDMPFPNAEILTNLVQSHQHVDAVVPKTERGFEPLFALYHRRVLPIIESFLQQNRFRIFDLFEQIVVNYIEPNELPNNFEMSLMNINTPNDYQLARKQLWDQTSERLKA
ncbi:molybdopterin-guanine dinucleotide biosynthesis protein A [Desulfuromusa kysingii]|uniref:Probable molybdenum cofactor guanylyltransferase n=1 Tax=Desulfuromusa kysingii TaxID=37625 RepID=A0A1H4A3M5_9BACT|nr:molybdenum cofactor guanylyltransferase [Desulfuromusa kysingii]SEA30507.1 molybdopterin-guanine dinucleotide biosynthesis protein A [Desulfuromusa kysingii]